MLSTFHEVKYVQKKSYFTYVLIGKFFVGHSCVILINVIWEFEILYNMLFPHYVILVLPNRPNQSCSLFLLPTNYYLDIEYGWKILRTVQCSASLILISYLKEISGVKEQNIVIRFVLISNVIDHVFKSCHSAIAHVTFSVFFFTL